MTSATPAARAALQRRTLRVLVVAQLLSGAGLAAGITVGALLAEDMLGTTSAAGLPVALFTAGSALAAFLVGRLSGRSGRRAGLAAGYAAGAVGGAGIVLAAAADSVPLLLVSLLVYGSGTATSLQARYAGADLAEPARGGSAVSTVLLATTAGAVLGPNLVDVMGDAAEAVDVPALAGPFMLAAAAYGAAAVALFVLLRPDPLLTARAWALGDGQAEDAPGGAEADDRTALLLAATAMVVSQLVMVAVMTMTPVHMRDHGHGLSATGLVISLHVAAMFLPSPLTGRLLDRLGRRPVIAAGCVLLLLAGVVAAIAPPESTAVLTIALVLLGLGWNFGLLGGTALLTDAVSLERRARTQGSADVAVALSGAGAGLGSGLVVEASSYAALSLASGVLGLAVLPFLLLARRTRRAGARSASPSP